MNKYEEIWETIFNEVAYLHNVSLDARKGLLAEHAANALAPFVMALLIDARSEGKTAAVNTHPSWWGTLNNPYRSEPNV